MFKYVSDSNSDFFKNGMIRFTQPGEFNDPFELQPHFSHVLDESWKSDIISNIDNVVRASRKNSTKWARKLIPIKLEILIIKLILKSENIKVLSLFEELNSLITTSFSSSFRDIIDDFDGILCLSETPDNLLMWAHYGNCHKGYVLEFDTAHSFFNQNIPNEKTGGTLEYSGKPLAVKYTTDRISTGFFDKCMTQIFLTKSKEWEYEREHRMILPLKMASDIVNKRIYLFRIPFAAVKSVYFGSRADDEYVHSCTKTINLWPEKHSELNILKYGLSKSKFSLIPEKV